MNDSVFSCRDRLINCMYKVEWILVGGVIMIACILEGEGDCIVFDECQS